MIQQRLFGNEFDDIKILNSLYMPRQCAFCGKDFNPLTSDYENCCSDECYENWADGEKVIDGGNGDYITQNDYQTHINLFWNKI